MRTIGLVVNGRQVAAAVEPRTQLADFLREQQLLTGTHLGCEHGVCGACTLLIDGEPARSCITYAVACEGAEITTIEGLDDDALMGELRDAFSREHALQCGFCTPGMLVTARDIVRRLPDADDARIRVELSGNLCRCTGYVGIVRAVSGVLEARRRQGAEPTASLRTARGPVGAGRAAPIADAAAPAAAPTGAAPAAPEPPAPVAGADIGETGRPAVQVRQSFTVRQPRDAVWAEFADVAGMVACLPGARLTAPVADDRAVGEMRVRLGPISARFTGEAEIARDDANYRGSMRGAGRDTGSGSRTRGELRYALLEAEGGAATLVEVDVALSLAGPLAQFGRAGIVNDLAGRLTDSFARNLEARMSGEAAPGDPARAEPAALDAGGLLLGALWARVKAFFAALFGRR